LENLRRFHHGISILANLQISANLKLVDSSISVRIGHTGHRKTNEHGGEGFMGDKLELNEMSCCEPYQRLSIPKP